jgi:hypothetical protein
VTQVKKVRNTLCTFVTSNFFTRCPAYGIRSQAFATTASAKVTAQKRSNRAALRIDVLRGCIHGRKNFVRQDV